MTIEQVAEIAPYILVPLVSAFIGWVTNLIAVRMLFRPYKPRRVLGVLFHGLIPRRQVELSRRIGETVEQNFINHEDVARVVRSETVQDEIAQSLEKQIDRFLTEQFASIPVIGSFLQGAVSDELRALAVKEIRGSIPELLDRLISRVESQMSFQEIVREKVEAFDLRTLEDIIYRIASRELKAIEWWGGVLGFLVGLLQVLIMFVFEYIKRSGV